jgi:hypothetical protein
MPKGRGVRLRLALVLIVLGVAGSAHETLARQGVQLSAMDMLDLYEHDRRLAVASFGDHLHLDSVWDELKAGSHKWINAKGAKDADRRRLVLATFVLEVVNLRASDDTGPAGRLIDWVCDELRTRRDPLPAERTWHMALIALLEHWGAGSFLETHLLHAEQRFPDEPRWLLIRAWCENHHGLPPPPPPHPCWDRVHSDHIWETCDAAFFAHTEDKYEQAMAVPAIAAEARVEFAFLHLKRAHYDVVLQLLNGAGSQTNDKELRYISELLQAWAYTGKGDTKRATAAFQLAANAIPHAQTAAIGLASNLLILGSRDAGARLLDAALTSDVADPWLSHRGGEYRRWPQLIAQLREALK